MLAAVAAVLFLCATPVAVVAAEPGTRSSCQIVRDDWATKHGAAPPKPREWRQESVEAQFQRFDIDCDGALTPHEYAEMQWALIAHWDQDGDASLSRSEYMEVMCGWEMYARFNARPLCEKEFARSFAAFAGRKNGFVDSERSRRVSAGRFRRGDRDGNGVLTIAIDRRRHAYQ